MAVPKTSATKTKKTVNSAVGAPSQRNQPSRKGKRAWRKNVDLDDVEEALEGLRGEERVHGAFLQNKKNDELFQIDTTGDSQVRKSLPKFSTSQLTSAKILAQRSAIPAVFSRPTTKRKAIMTNEDKLRLLRIAKRPRKGPFNAIMDTSELGAGSAILGVSEAVRKSGDYDAWVEPEVEEVKDGLEHVHVHKKPVKPPTHPHPRSLISIPAIAEPHQGTSYNPHAQAHQDLLVQAHELEQKRIKESEKLDEFKSKLDNAVGDDGMKVDIGEGEEGDQEQTGDEVPIDPRKTPQRKTKQQRRKAARVLAEKRALAEKARKKRMLASICSLIRPPPRSTASLKPSRKDDTVKLKGGLAGQRLGKHIVPTGEVDVQLGEELSESLRGLKPEGNLFRDRFLSMQHRALIEPRVPVLPKRKRRKPVEYEKHAWKKFE